MSCFETPSTFKGCYPKKLNNPGDVLTPGFKEFHALVAEIEANHIVVETEWTLQIDGGADLSILMVWWGDNGIISIRGETFLESSIPDCYLSAIDWLNERRKEEI